MGKKPKFDPSQSFETVGTEEDAIVATDQEEKPKPKFDPKKKFEPVEETVKKKDTTPVSQETGGKDSATASARVGKPSEKSTPEPTLDKKTELLNKVAKAEYDGWVTKRSTELTELAKKDPSKRDEIISQFEKENTDKITEINETFGKFGTIYHERYKEKYSGFLGTIKGAFDEMGDALNEPGERKRTVIDNALKRGLNLGAQAEIISPFSTKIPEDEKLKEVARLQKETQQLPASDAYNKFNQSKSVGDALSSLVENPTQIIAELTVESMASLANYGATRIAAGALIGSAIPGVGTGTGVIAGLADTSLALEYSGSFMESLQAAGVDVTDVEQLKKAFENDELISEARSHAYKKGIPIAIFDLISGGIAGKIVSKPAKSLLTKVGRAGLEFGAQATLGGTGEASGQIISGEEINPSAIIAEMIGELGTTPIEVSANLLGRARAQGNPENKLTVPLGDLNKTADEVIKEKAVSVDVNNPASLEQAAETIQANVDQKEKLSPPGSPAVVTETKGEGIGGATIPKVAEEKALQTPDAEKTVTQVQPEYEEINRIVDEFNTSGEEFQTIDDVINGIESVEKIPTIIQDAISKYRTEETENIEEWGGRGDSEQAESELLGTIDQYLKSQKDTDGKTKETVIAYTPEPSLSEEHKTIETRFGKYLNENFEEAKKTYFKKFGDILNADNARELSKDYQANKALSSAVHEPSAAFIRKLFDAKLDEEWFLKGKEDKAIFTSGGTGSGKTVSMQGMEPNEFRFIYDGNLDHFDTAKQRIDKTLERVKNVDIRYVYRDPVDAFENGVIKGMLSEESGRHGRTVPIFIHVQTHIGARENIEKLMKEYKGNENVKFTVIDNSRGRDGQKVVKIGQIPKITYTANELESKLIATTEKLYNDGKITKSQYEGLTLKRKPHTEGVRTVVPRSEEKVPAPDTTNTGITRSDNREDAGKPTGGIQEVATKPDKSIEQAKPAAQERKFANQILKDKNLSEEVKKGLSDGAKTYVPKGIKLTNEEATAIIQVKGLEQSLADYLDRSNSMTPDVRVVLGENLIRQFNAAQDFDNAIKVADNLSQFFTDLGRAVNAGKVFALLTPEGTLKYVTKEFVKAKDNYSRKTADQRKRSRAEVEAINKQALDKVLKSPGIKAKLTSEIKKGRVKQAIDFLETLKVDTKGKALEATYGITAAAWNTLITVVQTGLQAGLTLSQAINKAVAKTKQQYKDLDEAGARAFLTDKLKDYRVTLDPGLAIKEELKAQGEKLDDIIRKHYTEVEDTRTSLVDKLVNDSNLAPEEAQAISKQLSDEFDKLTRAAKERALKKYLPKEGRKGAKRKDLVDKIIDASNLGALSDEQYRDAISKELGPESLSPEQAKKINDLSETLQKAKEGFDKARATEKLLTYINTLKGISWKEVGMAIWYANILSGLSTQVLNLTANFFETTGEAFATTVHNPKESPWILKGLFEGWGRGYLESMDTIQHGHQPTKFEQKIQASAVLEQTKFKGGPWNPYNYLKYVTRIMNAADIFYYHGLREMRARELAVKMAKVEGKIDPSINTIKRATEIIYQGINPWTEALDQAKEEGWTGRDLKRRSYEIMEQKRPEFVIKDSNDEGARGTFNYDPEGILGSLTSLINQASEKVDVYGIKPIRFIVPFTRIISNVANRYLDWSPVGLIRAASGGIGFPSLGDNFYRKYTPEQRAKVLTKAIAGTVAMVTLWAMSDEEDGLFEITADGTGDTQKNFELQETGWRPYSIKIGDTWWEYKNTPLAIPFAQIGYIRDAEKYRGEKDVQAKMSIVLFGTAKYIMDLSFLQSLSGFFDTFSKQNPGSADNFFRKASKQAESTAKSFVVPNAFTQASRAAQEVMNMPIKKADSFGDQVIRDMPLLRDSLGNIYDALGDPVVPNQTEKFLPLKPSRANSETELLWNFIAVNNAWIGKPRRATQKPNGDTLTDEEYDKFALLAGQLTKKKLQQNLSRLSRMKDKEEIRDEVSSIKSEARREARDKLFGMFFF